MEDPETYKPTWRKPFGILALLLALILGTVWLLPLRRFLIWMETGRWG
jgi:hypothetical protein